MISRTLTTPLAALFAAAIVSMSFAAPAAAMMNTSVNADGDAGSIDLPGGLKEPGTVKGLEGCCTLDSSKCVVILKPFPGASRAVMAKRH